MKKLNYQSIFFIFIFTLTSSLFANPAKDLGLKIAKEMQTRNEGFVGESSKMTMVLIDAKGNQIERKMLGKTKEILKDGDKSVLKFQLPLDIKGTQLLTWTHKSNDDDQWLYLPSIRRVKRISSSNRSSSFMGSEFSYEDLGGQEVDKYDFTHLRDEKDSKGITLRVLERVSKKKSGYSKVILWYNTENAQVVKAQYFDRKAELLKEAIQSDLQTFKVKGKQIIRPGQIHMKNKQTRKESIFKWEERKLGVSHDDYDFAKNSLK